MLKNVYKRFNRECFSPEKYRRVLEGIAAEAGETVLRMCETPVFISPSFAAEVVQGATEIIQQAMGLADAGKLDAAVLPSFRMPSAPEKPSFFIIDFAVTEAGPCLIEMQAFASNLLFTPVAAQIYRDVYRLGEGYDYWLSATAEAAIKATILGGHAPENVILMEINPWQQKSRRDFVVTQTLLGIPVVDVTEVIKKGGQLFYCNNAGKDVRIRRIYNRVIATEFLDLHMAEKTAFKFTGKLDVEWAGDPSWFLKISKYAMPFLDHPLVPETIFLDQAHPYPADLENYVLKPVSFNAGIGVKLDVTVESLEAIPVSERHNYILMRKINFMPFIPNPEGHMLNAEIRVMFVWPDQLVPVAMSARVMRGNDTNKNLWGNDAWCGMAPVLVVKE